MIEDTNDYQSREDALVYRMSRFKTLGRAVSYLILASFFVGFLFYGPPLSLIMQLVVVCVAAMFLVACVYIVRRLQAGGPALVFDETGLTDFQNDVGPIPTDRILGIEGRRSTIKIYYSTPDMAPGERPKRLTIDVGALDRPPRQILEQVQAFARRMDS